MPREMKMEMMPIPFEISANRSRFCSPRKGLEIKVCMDIPGYHLMSDYRLKKA